MPKVMLRLRDMSTGDASTKEFDDVEDTLPWLGARPRFTEVQGVVFEGLTREQNDRMKAAMRALDDEEKAAIAKLDAEERERRQKAAEERAKEAAEANEARREAAAKAPVDRPMELRYRFDQEGLTKTEEHDNRPIPQEAIDAVMAWVAERTEWVESRGQMVGEAKVTVYPTTIPKGKERVLHGTFVPVTAPEKPKS